MYYKNMIGKSLPMVIVFLVNSASCLTVRHMPFCRFGCPAVLTCPAGNQATNLTWTGPGGVLYTTGTIINKKLSSYVRGISANHTGGTYRLSFGDFRIRNIGIYTCTVDGTANQQMVVVQDVIKVYTRLNGDVILQCPDRDGPVSWYTSLSPAKLASSQTIFKDGIQEDIWNRMDLINSNGTNSLIIRDIQLSDVGLYGCVQGTSVKLYALLVHSEAVKEVNAYTDDSITLTCPADNQATNLTWTGPGGVLYATGTTINKNLSSSVRNRISANHTGGTYRLSFKRSWPAYTGIYTCTVDGTANQQIVVVQVIRRVYTRQGDNVTIECPDDRPGDTARWKYYPDDVTISRNTVIYKNNLSKNLRERMNVSRHGGSYSLTIRNAQFTDIRLYVCLNPASNDLDGNPYFLLPHIPPNLPEVQNTKQVNGKRKKTETEGTRLILTCDSPGGSPPARVSWIRNGVTLITSDDRAVYTKVLTRMDHMTHYTCHSGSPTLVSPQTISLELYIQLKPLKPSVSTEQSQTENNDLDLECISMGSRPAAEIEWNVGGTWITDNPTELTILDSSTDTYTVTSTLTRRVTRQDNGKSAYCRSKNAALSGGIESERMIIAVYYGPNYVNITGNQNIVADRMNTLTLTCSTQEYNRYVHITWYNGTDRISNSAEVVNTSGSNGGYISTQVLQLTPDRYQDRNVIICVAQNEVSELGAKTASVTLDLSYPPLPPHIVSQTSTIATSHTIQWIPGFNGGAQQYFVIGIKSEQSSRYTELEPLADNYLQVQSYQITGLTEGTHYFIKMYAKNKFGVSEVVYHNLTTIGIQGKSGNLLSTGVVLIIISSFFIALVIAGFAIYKLKASTCNRQEQQPIDRQETTTFQQDSTEPPGQNRESTYERIEIPNYYEEITFYQQADGDSFSTRSYYDIAEPSTPNTSQRNSSNTGETEPSVQSRGNTYERPGTPSPPNYYEEITLQEGVEEAFSTERSDDIAEPSTPNISQANSSNTGETEPSGQSRGNIYECPGTPSPPNSYEDIAPRKDSGEAFSTEGYDDIAEPVTPNILQGNVFIF